MAIQVAKAAWPADNRSDNEDIGLILPFMARRAIRCSTAPDTLAIEK